MDNSWMQSTWMRWGVALGAAMGMGQGIFRLLVENLSPIAALLGGLTTLAVLTLGFYLLLTAHQHKSA